MNFIEFYKKIVKDFNGSQYQLKQTFLFKNAIHKLENGDWMFNLIAPTWMSDSDPKIATWRIKHKLYSNESDVFSIFIIKNNSCEIYNLGRYSSNELDEPKRILNEFLESFDTDTLI